jgi:hypothetical protein
MRGILAVALLLTTGQMANAAAIGSAPAVGTGQTVAVCYFSIISTATVSFSAIAIRREPTGGILPVVSNNCPASFTGPQSCRTVSNLTGSDAGLAHFCTAVVDNKGPVRGRLEIRNSANATVTSESVR